MNADALVLLSAGLKGHEGLVLRAYDDATGRVIAPKSYMCVVAGKYNRRPVGNVTVGYGRNLFGRGITQEEADYLLANDIGDVCEQLDVRCPWWNELDPVRQIVLADMAFNMGTYKFVNGWPNFLQEVREKQWGRAAARMRVSKWQRDVGDGPGGRDDRADKLIRMMESGRLP